MYHLATYKQATLHIQISAVVPPTYSSRRSPMIGMGRRLSSQYACPRDLNWGEEVGEKRELVESALL